MDFDHTIHTRTRMAMKTYHWNKARKQKECRSDIKKVLHFLNILEWRGNLVYLQPERLQNGTVWFWASFKCPIQRLRTENFETVKSEFRQKCRG